jgi:hypothetical protein
MPAWHEGDDSPAKEFGMVTLPDDGRFFIAILAMRSMAAVADCVIAERAEIAGIAHSVRDAHLFQPAAASP